MRAQTISSNPPPEVETVASRNWYAVATRFRHERLVVHQLNSVGVANFLPSVVELHQWSDRRKKVETPLFPGYVFLYASLSRDLRRFIAFAPGTAGWIGVRGEPSAIPAEQIETLQRLVLLRANCLPHPYLTVGQRVRIRGGALDGIAGILTEVEGQSGLVVSVDNISRSLLVKVEGYCVEPA